jgi:nucleoid-associated protein EbfC
VERNVDIQSMMAQAKEMQQRLQQQMADQRVEASAGGGMVTVVVSGTKQVLSVKIDPDVVSKADVEMLQDLIVAALNDASRKVDAQLGQSMSGLMGGLKIPGLF